MMPFRFKENIKPTLKTFYKHIIELVFILSYSVNCHLGYLQPPESLHICVFRIISCNFCKTRKKKKKKTPFFNSVKTKNSTQYVEWYKHMSLKSE